MANNLLEILKYAKIRNFEANYASDIHDDFYFGFPVKGILDAEQKLLSSKEKTIAYFSMEYGLATNVYNIYSASKPVKPENKLSENDIISNNRIPDYLFTLKFDNLLDLPIYSGGLGVLAGDTIKTAADLRMPLVAIGILWNKGYFKQRFWFKFGQLPEEMKWDPQTFPGLVPLENKIKLELKNRNIYLRLWKYYVFNQAKDFAVPLVLLDSNVEENDIEARRLTDRLYKSDDVDGRLLQRIILGMGGMKALEELGYPISLYHLNEGHAAFAFVQLARKENKKDIENLKFKFAYTCHTPVPAGHDRFSLSDCERVLTSPDFDLVKACGTADSEPGIVNLTILAMNTSYSINAVSKIHGDVMRFQFPTYKNKIKSVTNGVHFPTWVSEPIKKFLKTYDKVLGDFENDPTLLKNVLKCKEDPDFRTGLWAAHQENKKKFAQLLHQWKIREDVLTLCWARRIAAYKRPSLIFQDIERLEGMAKRIGPLQIFYAGKAHPNDNLAFTYINEIMNTVDKLNEANGNLKIVMLENYDIHMAKFLVSGVDVWLNNPLPPNEASGTSGMKAMANAVLQLSTVDGWVAEATHEDIGQFFGFRHDGKTFTNDLVLRLDEDSKALYEALENMMGLYYGLNQQGALKIQSPWLDKMINCLSSASYFNTFRMINEYRSDIWDF